MVSIITSPRHKIHFYTENHNFIANLNCPVMAPGSLHLTASGGLSTEITKEKAISTRSMTAHCDTTVINSNHRNPLMLLQDYLIFLTHASHYKPLVRHRKPIGHFTDRESSNDVY